MTTEKISFELLTNEGRIEASKKCRAMVKNEFSEKIERLTRCIKLTYIFEKIK